MRLRRYRRRPERNNMREDNRKKNSGFTLVEVLVAVAILAVVSIPILQSFVGVATVNNKSRRRLAATTVAETVMESCKGMTLMEFAAQCNGIGTFTVVYDQGGTTFGGSKKEVEWKSDIADMSAAVSSSNAAVGVASSEYVIKSGSTGAGKGYKFAFWIHGVKCGGGYYDAIVRYELDGTRSKDAFGTGKSVASAFAGGGITPMKYYNVTVTVFKSTSNSLATIVQQAPIVTVEGSVADSSRYQ